MLVNYALVVGEKNDTEPVPKRVDREMLVVLMADEVGMLVPCTGGAGMIVFTTFAVDQVAVGYSPVVVRDTYEPVVFARFGKPWATVIHVPTASKSRSQINMIGYDRLSHCF